MPATYIERHPLTPFLPDNARLLMLGSFPPPKERWCMPFFYPNPQNDMWRIMGQVFYGDKWRFVEKRIPIGGALPTQSKGSRIGFKYEDIVAFCKNKGIAIFDTAQAVRRLQGNASDNNLEIVESTDIAALLERIPLCHDICCTGGKAAETLAENIVAWQKKYIDDSSALPPLPKVGEYVETAFAGRTIRFWRMPSSSRAYPVPVEKKALAYQNMMLMVDLLNTNI